MLLGTNSIIGIGQTADPSQDFAFANDLVGTGCRRTGDLITLDYTEVAAVANTYASRTENVQPFAVVFWNGDMELNPSSDVWVDTRRIDAQIVNIEGNFEDMIEENGADPNTGLISTQWNSWQTDWIGVDVSTIVTNETRTDLLDAMPRPVFTRRVASGRGRERWPNGRIDGFRNVQVRSQDVNVEVTSRDTVTSTFQSRTGLTTRVVERIDSESLGDRVVDRENIPFMRSRNLEFIIRNAKPRTQMYGFFDGQDVSAWCFPKLLEVTMESGVFQVGEEVWGNGSGFFGNSGGDLRFRVATPNHKYGPYNAPSDIYTVNPYDDNQSIAEVYTSTSTILNIDTFSLQLQPQGQYYGYVAGGEMRLRGLTSGAEAYLSVSRLITDNVGTLIGSFFIPDAKFCLLYTSDAADE